MDQGMIVKSLFEGEKWYGFHDTVFEATGVSHSKEKLKELFLTLPLHIQMTAYDWGLSDTVFGDEVFVHITKEMAANKRI